MGWEGFLNQQHGQKVLTDVVYLVYFFFVSDVSNEVSRMLWKKKTFYQKDE